MDKGEEEFREAVSEAARRVWEAARASGAAEAAEAADNDPWAGWDPVGDAAWGVFRAASGTAAADAADEAQWASWAARTAFARRAVADAGTEAAARTAAWDTATKAAYARQSRIRELLAVLPDLLRTLGLAARLLDEVREDPWLSREVVRALGLPDLEAWSDWCAEMERPVCES